MRDSTFSPTHDREMTSYRITKYDPSKRNSDGSYSDYSEWTSITDIGNPKFRSPSYEEYESTESAYVAAFLLVLEEHEIDGLTIAGLESHNSETDFADLARTSHLRDLPVEFDSDVRTLQNGKKLSVSELDKVIRLILRETVWMLLNSNGIEVKFGYDYYMYISCDPLSDSTIARIEANGLFVEPDVEQLRIVVVDKDGNPI